jgi:hypothetical protein
MLGWLRRLGERKPLANPAGIDSQSVELLAEDFKTLKDLDSGLLEEVLRFVVDGEDADVLQRLTATKGASVAMRIVGPFTNITAVVRSMDTGESRAKFYESVQCCDPAFFVRLGKVYAAALESEKNHKSQLLAQFPHLSAMTPQPSFGDASLSWLETLLIEACQLKLNTWPRSCRPCAALNAEMVEAILKAEGHAPGLLVRSAFAPQLQRFGGPPLEAVFNVMPGLAESAVRHRDEILYALGSSDFQRQVYALGMMKNCKVPVTPFVATLVDLALDSSKQVREQTEPLLKEAATEARPHLERKVVEGSNAEKALAVKLLWAWDGERARAFLQNRLSEETNQKVRLTIEEALAVQHVTAGPNTSNALALPPLPAIPNQLPLGPETEHAWHECFKQINACIARMLGGTAPRHHRQDLKPVTPEGVRKGFAMLQGGETKTVFLGLAHFGMEKEYQQSLSEFWQRAELQPAHLIRFLVMVGALRRGDQEQHGVLSYGWWMEFLVPIYRRTHPEVGLRELGAAFPAAGLSSARLGYGLTSSYWEQRAPFGLPPNLIWPYWAEHLDVLAQSLEPATGDYTSRWRQRHSRRNIFHALATFPQPPAQLVPKLWELAIGPKSERPVAQRCLESLPDKMNRLIAALSSGAAESRFAAAEWLARLGDQSAIEPLTSAMKKEKNESAKGAMMSALEQLGVPVEQFLDRAGLLKDAAKGLGKGIPEDLQWFPFDQLPAVHWAENGRVVEAEIIRWWIVQNFKLKNPEPGALLRKYCGSLKTAEREALGQFVLEAWIGEDTAPIARAEAEKEAMAHAQSSAQAAQYWAQWVKQNPQAAQQMSGFTSPQKTVQEYYEDFLPGFLQQPKGSAVASKGILAVAGACAGAGAAPVVGRYLKQWYGMRAAQCRALIQMLAWVEHKTATQLLLAVGSRFRTKSIQEEANKQAAALAERKGWTVAELADRTIPTAGLDDEGVLTLDFGPRQFTAKLNEELEFVLADAEGKALKSLPDPRKDDDEAKAADAKKLFSAAKKELKSVVTLQRDRFYEAMCTQRTWPFEDWNMYLNRHPVARHHCQRLVWSVVRDEKIVALFRPLPDGSLTDVNDDPVTLVPEDLIRVAHECHISPEQSQAWRQHLKDYEIEPLFEQFGRPGFDLAEERKQEDELADFRGHILEAFKLRGRANKLGYTRGQAQDGGWFFDYHKRFPTLGIEAILEFTGNGMPEENRTVALTTFRFERVVPDGESAAPGAKMPLGEVPPVLLSECWNDLRQIAAEGPGFDAEWEKKAQM